MKNACRGSRSWLLHAKQQVKVPPSSPPPPPPIIPIQTRNDTRGNERTDGRKEGRRGGRTEAIMANDRFPILVIILLMIIPPPPPSFAPPPFRRLITLLHKHPTAAASSNTSCEHRASAPLPGAPVRFSPRHFQAVCSGAQRVSQRPKYASLPNAYHMICGARGGGGGLLARPPARSINNAAWNMTPARPRPRPRPPSRSLRRLCLRWP